MQAVFFDLDGTLLDQEAAEREALEKLFTSGIDLEPKPQFHDFLRAWRNQAEGFLQRYLENKITFEEQRSQRVMAVWEAFGAGLGEEQAREVHRAYLELYSREWRLYEDAKPCLEALKKRGLRLGVLSNGDGRQQRDKILATGIAGFFEQVVISSDIRVAKPRPGIFGHAARLLGGDPEHLAYVGDRLDTDAKAARACGWRGIWLDRKGMPYGDPDRIAGLLDLPSALQDA